MTVAALCAKAVGVALGHVAKARHPGAPRGDRAAGAVLDHEAGGRRGAAGRRRVQEQVRVRFRHAQRVGGVAPPVETGRQAGGAEGDLHLLVAAVGGHAIGDARAVQRIEQVRDAFDDRNARPQRGVGLGVDLLDPAFGQVGPHPAGLVTDTCHAVADKGHHALGQRQGQTVPGKVGGQNTVRDRLAVHQHAVAIEDDQIGPGHGPSARNSVMTVPP